MRNLLSGLALSLALPLVAWGQGRGGDGDGDRAAGSLEERMAAVLPRPEEDRWLEIEWHTNIAEARAEAARQGKPVLLWVMNGNPLGCG